MAGMEEKDVQQFDTHIIAEEEKDVQDFDGTWEPPFFSSQKPQDETEKTEKTNPPGSLTRTVSVIRNQILDLCFDIKCHLSQLEYECLRNTEVLNHCGVPKLAKLLESLTQLRSCVQVKCSLPGNLFTLPNLYLENTPIRVDVYVNYYKELMGIVHTLHVFNIEITNLLTSILECTDLKIMTDVLLNVNSYSNNLSWIAQNLKTTRIQRNAENLLSKFRK